MPGWKRDRPATGSGRARARRGARAAGAGSGVGRPAHAVAAAGTGRGGAAIVTGEAGIGKTSVVRALRASLDHGVRVLAGACDDLLSPRASGRCATAAGTAGPLAAALTGEHPDVVPGAAVAELAAWRPTVLILEDLHWADDATLDVLGHVARRLADLPALLVLTFRDEEVPPAHPCAASSERSPRRPCSGSRCAPVVGGRRRPRRGRGRDSAALHALTGGNPFYVTEALAAPGVDVPATVADAVLARVGRLDPPCRDAVEQLVGRPHGRRGSAWPAARRAVRHAGPGRGAGRAAGPRRRPRVPPRARPPRRRAEPVRAAAAQPAPAGGAGARRGGAPRPAPARPPRGPGRRRRGHPGLRPAAGREAAAAGSHRQALALLQAALRYADRLPAGERARLHDDHAWELLQRTPLRGGGGRVRAGGGALPRTADEPLALGAVLVRLSRPPLPDRRHRRAEEAAEAALRTVRPLESPRRAFAGRRSAPRCWRWAGTRWAARSIRARTCSPTARAASTWCRCA